MTEVHQVLVSAAAGDAITNSALDLRRALRRRGRSEIYAAFVSPEMEGEARPLRELGRRAGAADLLVLHVSIGEPLVSEVLEERPEPLAIVYHNISPAAAYEAWAPEFARLLEGGRRFLAGLAGRARVAVAVSELNAAELRALGFGRVEVVPLVVDPGSLTSGRPDRSMTARLRSLDGPVVLHVGQVLPHKRLDWLVMAYHALVTHLVPEAHLVVVGAERQERYSSAVRALVSQLELRRVHMLGTVSQAALVSCYRAASVFATASEHEGFCAPLLEAMAFDVPVVARAFGAVPETLAGAGVLLGRGDGPLLGAEALRAMLEDPEVRSQVVAGGRERVARLDPARSRAALVEALLRGGQGG